MKAIEAYAMKLCGLFLQAVAIGVIVWELLRWSDRIITDLEMAVYGTFGMVTMHLGMALEGRLSGLSDRLHRRDIVVIPPQGGAASARAEGDHVAQSSEGHDPAGRRVRTRGSSAARSQVEPQRPDGADARGVEAR